MALTCSRSPWSGKRYEPASRISGRPDRKLAQHRAALEAGADPAVVTQWIAETRTQCVAAQAQLREASGTRRITRKEIDALVTYLGGLVAVIRNADANGGLKSTYRPQKQLVEARVEPDLHMCKRFVSEGDSTNHYARIAAADLLLDEEV